MPVKTFEKFARTYGQYNIVQKHIIKKFLPKIKSRIVDLGCGSEGLCKYKKFDFYLGVDNSAKMLRLNPCRNLKADFNTKECFEIIKNYKFDQIVSFSALQWAKDLDFVFREIKNLQKKYLLGIFTSNTFKNLHNFLEISSPIHSKESILKKSEVLNPNVEVLHYKLIFNTAKNMLEYIKYSGVGGEAKAKYSKIKAFLKQFPFNTLDFEIIVLENKI